MKTIFHILKKVTEIDLLFKTSIFNFQQYLIIAKIKLIPGLQKLNF